MVQSLFVLIGNPLNVFVLMDITLGHVDVQTLRLTTLVGLVTITVSTHMIPDAQPLYERLTPWLRVFERQQPFREITVESKARHDRRSHGRGHRLRHRSLRQPPLRAVAR